MNHSPFAQYNGLSGLRVTNPITEYRLVDDYTMCYGSCDPGAAFHDRDTHRKDQDFGDASKDRLGRAIRHTAEKIGDKAAELRDKTKQKILEGFKH